MNLNSFSYIDNKYDAKISITKEYLNSKLLIIATSTDNYDNCKVVRETESSLLFELPKESGVKILSWIPKKVLNFKKGEINVLFITLPKNFKINIIR